MKKLSDIPRDSWPHSLFHTLSFVTNAPRFLEKQQRKYGNIYRCNLLGYEYVRVQGPVLAERVYQNSNDLAVCASPWQTSLSRLFFNGLLKQNDFSPIAYRTMTRQAVSDEMMNVYFHKIQLWAGELVDELLDLDVVDIYPFIKEQTLVLSLRLFPGIDYQEALSQNIAQVFTEISQAATRLELLSTPVLQDRNRRDQELSRRLRRALVPLVQDRRAKPKPDLASYLCRSKNEKGKVFSDEQVVEQLVFMLKVTHSIATSVLSSVLYFLARYPQWQQQINQEMKKLGPLLQLDELSQLSAAEAVFKETVRLFPPLVASPQKLQNEITVDDFFLPENTRAGVNIYSTHRDPQYWQQPDDFKPERFLNGHSIQHPYQFIPFGSQSQSALGLQFSQMLVQIVVAELCSRASVLSHRKQTIRFKPIPFWRPEGKLELRFEPLEAI